jgi:hypothetical protein
MASLPNAKTVTYELSPQAVTVAVLRGNTDILQPKLFPHVEINIAQIWPD